MNMHKYNQGAVSLFIVVFFSLLLTVFTVSFVRITLKGLEQASTIDLSQSAYDSAQAGVEDAKRALIRLGNVCGPFGSSADCTITTANIYSATCNDSLKNIVPVTSGEIKVQQTTGDEALDQAYTCVTITKDTPDFLGSLASDESKTVPLKGLSNFDRIKIEWFNKNNIAGSSNDISLLKTSDLITASPIPIIAQSDYPVNRPPVLRAHLVQVGSSFNPADIENPANTSSLYLYPASGAVNPKPNNPVSIPFTDGARKTQDKKPLVLDCQKSLAAANYACAIELVLPSEVSSSSTALLQVASIYNGANFKVTLCKGTCSDPNNVVKFDGIQPMIDSTGRANDIFRRVQVRVEPVDAYPYPESTVQTSGNFCKNFFVTDNTADYWQSGCNP